MSPRAACYTACGLFLIKVLYTDTAVAAAAAAAARPLLPLT